jgi:PIN domain nuclease of toxin-antitoxin system
MSERFLLDTHALIWAVAEPERLGPGVRLLIENHDYAVSVACLWELINKQGKHDAPLKDPAGWWRRYVVELQTPVLAIRSAHVLYLEHFPWHHRDPYDRILMAQSVVEKMPLVTADDQLRKYGIELREATS